MTPQPITVTQALLPCPLLWCQSPTVKIKQPRKGGNYHAECMKCGASGPSCETEAEAFDRWNQQRTTLAPSQPTIMLENEHGLGMDYVVKPAPSQPMKHDANLTDEYLAMTPLQKWETLCANGLIGTNEPWIEDMRQSLKAMQSSSQPIEYGRKHTDGSRSGGQPQSTMYPRTYLECSVKDFGATPDAPSQHNELADRLQAEVDKQSLDYDSVIDLNVVEEAVAALRQSPDTARRDALEEAGAGFEERCGLIVQDWCSARHGTSMAESICKHLGGSVIPYALANKEIEP